MDQIFVYIKKAIVDLVGTFLPESVEIMTSILISITVFCLLGPLLMMYMTWLERKVVGRIQNRLGPNRVGKFGLLQPIADGIKMLTKEDIVPKNADKIVHLLAPILIIAPALLLFAVIPFGKNMTAIDLNIGLIFFLAVSSITTIPIFMASWGSRNKYSLLGGMRSVAQMISYEIPMVLSVVPVILTVGSLSTVAIVDAQSAWGGFKWFLFTPWGLVSFVVFFLCSVAECNRSPFDLPEAESEIIAGFHTEYSGMKFALFYMAEFMNTFTLSALTVTLFLGGWQGPFLPSWIWFFLKTFVIIFIMVWFRGTLPRVRVDQLMGLAWKVLLPVTLVNVIISGFWYYYHNFWALGLGTILLFLTLIGFMKLNRNYMPEKRVYTYGN